MWMPPSIKYSWWSWLLFNTFDIIIDITNNCITQAVIIPRPCMSTQISGIHKINYFSWLSIMVWIINLMLITGVRFNWNFLSQTCSQVLSHASAPWSFLHSWSTPHVGRLFQGWQKLPSYSPQTNLAVTIWSIDCW